MGMLDEGRWKVPVTGGKTSPKPRPAPDPVPAQPKGDKK